MTAASILWRRLDRPGHDACRLEQRDAGWTLDGTAVFREDGVPARLDYHVACDLEWRTRQGEVGGRLGARSVDFRIMRTPEGVWTLDGASVPNVGNCVDLDLGFTPATNLLQLRRLALGEGQAADAPVAWLDVGSTTLEVLAQRYERRSETTYWYEAPRFDYAALLEVTPDGFIRRYPGLWEEVVIDWGAGWQPVHEPGGLDQELSTELAPEHPLSPLLPKVIGRCLVCDDVVTALVHAPGEAELAVVHLTWRQSREKPPWPYHELVTTAEFIRRFLPSREHL